MRGLSEKGKKDYPKFSRKQLETKECEICTGIKNVKKYQIIKKSGNTDEIYMCDTCLPLVPKGVEVICLEKTETEQGEEPIEFKPETDESQGDTLLI